MTEMTVVEMIGLALIAIGILFDVSGCIGLVRMPDVYNRIQAASKCVTIGTSMIVLGSVIMMESVPVMLKGLLCVGFVLVTASTAAHALARAAHRAGVAACGETVVDRYKEDQEAAL